MYTHTHTHDIGTPQYIRQMLTTIKREINSNTIIVGDISPPLKPIDRSSRQKINKETQALYNTLGQINIYTAFHQKAQNTHCYQMHMEYFLD